MNVLVNEKRLVRTFIELTAIDSESGNEAAISKRLHTELSSLGLAKDSDDLMGNLLAYLPATHAGKALLLSAHMDTVRPGRHVQAVCKDGILVSQGQTILGADDKAGIAAILEALRVLRERSIAHAAIGVLFTHGEESGLKGVQSVANGSLRAEYGYTFDGEGPVGGMIHRSYGQTLLTVVFHVDAASALTAMAVARRAVHALKSVRGEKEAQFTVVRFAGNDLQQATIVFSIQSVNAHQTDSIVSSIRTICEKQAVASGGTACFQTQPLFSGYDFASDHALVRQAEAAIQQIGRMPTLLVRSGGSDANCLSSEGLPTLNLTVGFEKIHTVAEYLPVQELIKASELILALIEQAMTDDRRRDR